MKYTEPFEFWADYDEEADVLYISFERPQKATDGQMQSVPIGASRWRMFLYL